MSNYVIAKQHSTYYSKYNKDSVCIT